MVTRSMKANGRCIRFPKELTDRGNAKENAKGTAKGTEKGFHEIRKRKNRERVQIVYRDNQRARLIQYIHFFGAFVSYTYCFFIYTYLFLFIRNQKVWTQDPNRMIGY